MSSTLHYKYCINILKLIQLVFISKALGRSSKYKTIDCFTYVEGLGNSGVQDDTPTFERYNMGRELFGQVSGSTKSKP